MNIVPLKRVGNLRFGARPKRAIALLGKPDCIKCLHGFLVYEWRKPDIRVVFIRGEIVEVSTCYHKAKLWDAPIIGLNSTKLIQWLKKNSLPYERQNMRCGWWRVNVREQGVSFIIECGRVTCVSLSMPNWRDGLVMHAAKNKRASKVHNRKLDNSKVTGGE